MMIVRAGWKRGGWTAIAALAGGLVAGCGPGKPADTEDGGGTGSTGEDVTPTTGADPTIADGTTGEPDATTGPEPSGLCVPAPTLTRRLSNAQYVETLRDLLPGVEPPPLELPPEEWMDGYDHLADAQLPWDFVAPTYVEAAKKVAAAAVAQPPEFLPCAPDGSPDPMTCGYTFAEPFATRAFRRPLSVPERDKVFAAFDAGFAADGFLAGIEATIAAVLGDASFVLVVEEGGAPVEGQPELVRLTPFQLASRMSLFLWNTTPDDELLTAASSGELDTPAGIEAQARRLIDDPRGRAAFVRFAQQWLHLQKLVPDHEDSSGPEWVTPALLQSLRGEFARLVDHAVFDGEGTLAGLLTTDVGHVDATLAEIYGVPAPAAGFAQVELDPSRRSGLFTRAAWLALHSHHEDQHSPVKRGTTLLRRVYCFDLPPPIPDVPSLPPPNNEPMTTRERLDQGTNLPQCLSCHAPMHGVAYGLENYDAVGKWRDTENGKPIDASGEIDPMLDAVNAGPFVGSLELSQRLADSEVVQRCATRHVYLYALGRGLQEADACDLEKLQTAFIASGGQLRELLVEIVLSDGFRHRLAE